MGNERTTPPAYATRPRRRASIMNDWLHLVAAQVLVVQALEPAAKLFGRWSVRRPGRIQLGRLQHLFGNKNGPIGAQSQGNRVRRPGVNRELFVALGQPQDREKGIVLKLIDDN